MVIYVRKSGVSPANHFRSGLDEQARVGPWAGDVSIVCVLCYVFDVDTLASDVS